jgi:hypothetical protein
LLPDFDNLNELRRIGIKIDHVAGFLGGLRTGIHRHADIRLPQRWSIVGAVAGHGHKIV